MPATVMSRHSYPKVSGDNFQSITDVTGPASYVPITMGTPPTGGQLVTAADFGLQALDWVGAMGNNSGQFIVNVIPGSFSSGNEMQSVHLMWAAAVTGSQAGAGTNLSMHTVRLFAIGR